MTQPNISPRAELFSAPLSRGADGRRMTDAASMTVAFGILSPKMVWRQRHLPLISSAPHMKEGRSVCMYQYREHMVTSVIVREACSNVR